MQWLKAELGVVKRKSDSKIEGWWTYIEGCISYLCIIAHLLMSFLFSMIDLEQILNRHLRSHT